VTERTYELDDGRILHVTVMADMWSVWLDEDLEGITVGWPLENMIVVVLGLDVFDGTPAEIERLAARIRDDFGDYGAPDPTT
jgi:hypothetical protein